ncbi:MAG: hypothetical protein PHS41_06405, partial [Victivallaceae bacterium]|nr:hypothetical protein [Victivallaceae bacterium]
AFAGTLPLTGKLSRLPGEGQGLSLFDGTERIFFGCRYRLLDRQGKEIVDRKASDYREKSAVSRKNDSLTILNAYEEMTVRCDPPAGDRLRIACYLVATPHPQADSAEFVITLDPKFTEQLLPEKSYPVESIRNGSKIYLDTPSTSYLLDFSKSNVGGVLERIPSSDSKKFRYQLRFQLPCTPGKKAANFFISKEAPRHSAFRTYDLAPFGNRGLSDELANDQKGGWTDQGANDLRRFPAGKPFESAKIPFLIKDKVIVLQSKKRPYFPAASPVIPLGDIRADRLAFCHTVAWDAPFNTEVFRYTITYADGSSASFPVRYGVDVADWWGGMDGPNAKIAWSGANNESGMGFHHAQWVNPHPDKAIRSIKAESAGTNAVPVVLAVTAILPLQDAAVTKHFSRQLEQSFRERSGSNVDTANWYPCPLDWNGKIIPGSALDVSFLNHKPAGKYGFLRTVGDHFEFTGTPGKPVRFWGTNIAIEGPFPAKDLAPGIAKTLAAQGCNMVRLHLWGIQNGPAPRNVNEIINRDGTLKLDALDRMEFFISELKKNGIYIYMDWNDGLMYDRLDPELAQIADYFTPAQMKMPYKFFSLYNQKLAKAAEKLARMVFLHKNPYTGLTMTEDPAFAMFEIANELTLTRIPDVLAEADSPAAQSPYWQELRNLYAKWRRDHKLAPKELTQKFPPDQDAQATRFLAETQRKIYRRNYTFLRNLGVKVPIGGINWTWISADSWSQQDMDFANTHYYNEAKRVGPGTYPGPQVSSEVKTSFLHGAFFKNIARAQLVNKPFVVSEWNYTYPGNVRCEGMPIMTALASLNGWDAPLMYCATGSFDGGKWELWDKQPIIRSHTQQLDPATWGQSQTMAVAFRREYIQEAKNPLTLKFSEKDVFAHFAPTISYPFLCRVTKVQSEFLPAGQPSQWPVAGKWPIQGNPAVQQAVLKKLLAAENLSASEEMLPSVTGEIRHSLNPGLFVVDTPKCQMAVGDLKSFGTTQARSFKDFSIQSNELFATISFLSLDGAPLKESRRILATMVGNARNTKAKIHGARHSFFGMAPVLAEPLEAQISCATGPAGSIQVFALNAQTGARKEALEVKTHNGRSTFTLSGQKQQTIYYEIIRSKAAQTAAR